MNFLTYLGIFLFKILEDALATLRLIVVSNGKKTFGAILQFICTIIWVILSGSVLMNFMEDFFKVVSFSLGGFVGSYIGSFLEEKMALGTNLLIVKSKKEALLSIFSYYKYFSFSVDSYFFNILVVPRKKLKKIIKFIHFIDNEAFITCEKINYFK